MFKSLRLSVALIQGTIRLEATLTDTKSSAMEEVFGLPANGQYLGRMELEGRMIPFQFGGWQGGPAHAGTFTPQSIVTNTLIPEPTTAWTVAIGLVLLQILRSARRRRMIKE